MVCVAANMAKWLDRQVYTDNLIGNEDAPDCEGGDANSQPGLKQMTIKGKIQSSLGDSQH